MLRKGEIVQKTLDEAKNILNKIKKNIKRADLDWTVQISVNSIDSSQVYYSAQLDAPANGLQPMTWVCKSPEELIEKLKISEKNVDAKEVQKAWHKAEIQRAEALKRYHEESLENES